MSARRSAGLGMVCLIALAVWLISTAGAPRARAPQLRPKAGHVSPRPAHARATRAISSGGGGLVARLSLAQLAGQRIIYAYSGLQPPATLLSLIRAGEAGGVILFGRNVSGRAQIRGAIAQLQRAAMASPLHRRLLILVDQEGGQVRRLSGAPLLSERQIGVASNASALAQSAGSGAGQNLRGVGVNVNLAPVLDVYRRPGDFIDQYGRSYSSLPGRVASLGAAFISAQQRTGVSATAKHFPGLGAAATAQNTDLGPVRLTQSLATLRTDDEAPYRAAMAAGLRLVMTSWAIYPALDPRRPAGLSPVVIGQELRERLGFRGVTITDGINAGAVTPFGSLGHRSVLAATAGADLILCAATNPADNTPQLGITAMRALQGALAGRRLSLTAARQAAARITALPR